MYCIYVVVQIYPWFNVFWSSWFQFYVPLFQIMIMNTWQKKIKIEPGLKIVRQN